ncbi:MAG TPA: undecaprenyldiphospho-muramoylpentapeptide beta-N-acetylglucosaminyltransferase [Bacillaceae bacterium]
MKIVVSGGGTGGHIYPALALIRTIREQYPDTEFLYVGTETGLEAAIVRREGIPFKTIDITGFKRSLSFENIKTILRFVKGVRTSNRILHTFQPDAVIGTGGYVCGPIVYAAAKRKIPTIIHEQNSVPGLTNKFLSRFVDKVAICFDSAREFFPQEKVVLTGNPRASEVVGTSADGVLEPFGLKDHLPTALIVGGSRGARPINEAVLKALSYLADKPYQVLYVTGQAHFDEVEKEAALIGRPDHVAIVPFIHNMQEVLAAVDVAVGRAGATSLAEITALGIPSILIPSPYVTNDHQMKNAEALLSAGAALLIAEKDLTGRKLADALDNVLLDDEKRKGMGDAARKLGIPDASERLFRLIAELAKERPDGKG